MLLLGRSLIIKNVFQANLLAVDEHIASVWPERLILDQGKWIWQDGESSVNVKKLWGLAHFAKGLGGRGP
jgi:hypothetical protein